MKKGLLLIALLFALSAKAQEWASMNELIVKIPLGIQTRCYTDGTTYQGVTFWGN